MSNHVVQLVDTNALKISHDSILCYFSYTLEFRSREFDVQSVSGEPMHRVHGAAV